jgi:CoA:oxalate CoA-transferase
MKVLEGVTVIDFTQAYSGPFSTMQLADFGARVIKIERNKYGDQSRYWAPINEKGESGYYAAINRGKESITLNIGTPEGIEIAKKLIAKADIMVENFSVGSMEKKGLGYEEVKKINPEIIYGSISGYGQNSSWSKLPAYDNVIQAQTGLMEMTGDEDGVPTKVGVSVGDNYTGLEMSLAIALAYYNKLKTGKGQYIDVAMYDTLFEILELPILTYELDGVESTRCGNTDPTLFPYDVYPCKDGYFSPGVAAGSKKEWKAFCEAIEMPELLENERWMSNDNRLEDYDELTAKILPFFAERTKAELTEIFTAHKIPNAPVKTILELIVDPQLKARDMLIELDDPGIGKYVATGNPMKLSMTPPVIEKPAPLLGADTDSILTELGYDAAAIAKLHDEKIV